MSKEIIKTSDGSATINSPYAGETYHSINGALTESIHIFVKNGFLKYLEKAENTSTGNVIVNIFEVGFGTGLNCVATLCELSAHPSVFVNYYSIEMFPLSLNEYKALEHGKLFPKEYRNAIERIYESEWNIPVAVSKNLSLVKIKGNLENPLSYNSYFSRNNKAHIVYFDAFSPGVQPQLWQPEIFRNLNLIMAESSLLVTYSSKGIVKAALRESGFDVTRKAGPPGKRHITIAEKKRDFKF